MEYFKNIKERIIYFFKGVHFLNNIHIKKFEIAKNNLNL